MGEASSPTGPPGLSLWDSPPSPPARWLLRTPERRLCSPEARRGLSLASACAQDESSFDHLRQVREQFRQYTEATLAELERLGGGGDPRGAAQPQGSGAAGGPLPKAPAPLRALATVVERPAFQEWLARRERERESPRGQGGKSPLAYYGMLARSFGEGGEGGAGGGGRGEGGEGGARLLTTKEGSMLLFNLHASLTNNMSLSDIEALVEAGAVARLSTAAFLSCESATVRKYTVQVLAHLSTALKGQVSFLCHGVLPRVVSMLSDPMPAVSAAAANCLYKVSGLYIGVQAMLTAAVVPSLTSQLLRPSSSDLVLRSHLASTLLQVYRFCPDAPLDAADAAALAARLQGAASSEPGAERQGDVIADRELAVLLLQVASP